MKRRRTTGDDIVTAFVLAVWMTSLVHRGVIKLDNRSEGQRECDQQHARDLAEFDAELATARAAG